MCFNYQCIAFMDPSGLAGDQKAGDLSADEERLNEALNA